MSVLTPLVCLLLGPSHYPVDVAEGPQGERYVADRDLPGIWRLSPSGEATELYRAGSGFAAPLRAIRAVAVDKQGRLWASDTGTRAVYRFDSPGGDGPHEPQRIAEGLRTPIGLAIDDEGIAFVADLGANCIWQVRDGAAATRYVELRAPVGLCVEPSGSLLVVTRATPQLVRVSRGATPEITPLVEGTPFRFPHDVAVAKWAAAGPDPNPTRQQGAATVDAAPDRPTSGAAGGVRPEILVSDGYARSIWRVAGEGAPQPWSQGEPWGNPVGLGWGADGLLVADPRAPGVFVVDRQAVARRLDGQ